MTNSIDDPTGSLMDPEERAAGMSEATAPPSTVVSSITPAVVKAPEAAKILGMHEGNVRKLAVEGKLHGKKVGRSWIFKLQDVFALKQAREKALDPKPQT